MAAPTNLHLWMAEPLIERPGAVVRRMFGGTSIYIDGVMLLVLADGEQPWNGLLFPVERAVHAEVLADFPWLTPHTILPKWLYLSVEDEHFEERGHKLIRQILEGDLRFGVIPPPRKKRGSPKKAEQKPAPDGRPPHLR